jgi:putative addiction module component (TIGR02574 family)
LWERIVKLQEVRESALALPLRSRAKLATELIRSLEVERPGPPGSERTEAEWKEEIKRRIDEHDRGEAKTVPGEEVMKWLRKRMK